MAFVPFASWNSRSITHLANYLSRSLPMNSSDESKKQLKLKWSDTDSGDLHKTAGPEDVFAYAYAVFNTPSYRTRYTDFLKRDFPHLPLTSDLKLFAVLVAKGQELITWIRREFCPFPTKVAENPAFVSKMFASVAWF